MQKYAIRRRSQNATGHSFPMIIATHRKGWQFWRPHPRDFWYIGSEINEADVSVFVLIYQQGCGWCGEHSFWASEGASAQWSRTKYHKWRPCREGWQKLSGWLTWLTLFALRSIWKRVMFRFKIHDCCALTSRKFQDVHLLITGLASFWSCGSKRADLAQPQGVDLTVQWGFGRVAEGTLIIDFCLIRRLVQD